MEFENAMTQRLKCPSGLDFWYNIEVVMSFMSNHKKSVDEMDRALRSVSRSLVGVGCVFAGGSRLNDGLALFV